jgi:superfamily II DNA or RNA helicase
MNRLHQIENELATLEQRRSDLLSEKKDLLSRAISHQSAFSPEEKIQIFLTRFACRLDVYPRFWENTKDGRKGYAPVCSNEWKRFVCEKPRIKCGDCMHQAFLPLDETAAREHLTGKNVIGTYAIRADHQCVFLAADFDEGNWQQDVTAYKNAAERHGVTVAIERSRSGNGGHAWIIFSEAIPAALARRLGTIFLSEAQRFNPFLSLKSYDRLFPNQDTLAPGGFGNLIALPLQEKALKLGNSLFLDDSLIPYEDQWSFLASLPLCHPALVESIVANVYAQASDDPSATFEDKSLDAISTAIHKGIFSGVISAKLGKQLEINLLGLPRELIAALKRLGTISNPVFYEKQRLRFPTYLIPRLIFCGEIYQDRLILPRGVIDKAESLVRKAGAIWQYDDARLDVPMCEYQFSGNLYEEQQVAVHAMLSHDHGVLQAPPGAGKTVMACALIAARKSRTLILVHRKPLMEQWLARVSEFLGLDKKQIGLWGGKKCNGEQPVVIAMIQGLMKSSSASGIFDEFGHVIIDECHHVPATSFEALMKECSSRYILGLTATPQRKDGLQKILFLQCGPIRHELEQHAEDHIPRYMHVRHLKMNWHDDVPVALHEIWDRLIHDENRNQLIVHDAVNRLEERRSCALLSDRKEHLEILSEMLRQNLVNPKKIFHLTGSLSAKSRHLVMNEIQAAIEEKNGFLLLATSSLIGEGFDIPALDTLILAMPISFRGRLTQYAGRIQRRLDGKSDSRIFDYTEDDVPVSISMFRKRLQAYRAMGYQLVDSHAKQSDQ